MDFVEHFGLMQGGRTEQLVELIGKIENLLGRPVEATEFRAIVKASYPQAEDNLMSKITQGITQARKIDIQVITLKELQKMSGIRLPEHLFRAELEKKTQRKLASLKGAYIPGTHAKIEWIKKDMDKIKMSTGAPSFFMIRGKEEEAIRKFRQFWKEN